MRNYIPFFFLTTVLLVPPLTLFAQKPHSEALSKPTYIVEKDYVLINVNQIALWVRSDGSVADQPSGAVGGGFGPDNIPVLYRDGLNWGGLVGSGSIEERLRVGGQRYRVATQPGWITTPGTSLSPPIAIDRNDPRARVYSVRRDYQQLSLRDPAIIRQAAGYFRVSEMEVSDSMAQAVIDRFDRDWREWPADLGAPFTDLDGNGQYDWQIDNPGFRDADQTVWLVYNDLDTSLTRRTYFSLPMGLEVQLTLWACKSEISGREVIFRNHRIINKSDAAIDSFYAGQWADLDLGSFTDDLVGCDSLLQAGFSYTGPGENPDSRPKEWTTPVAGYQLISGYSGENKTQMRAFGAFAAASGVFDPCPECDKLRIWNMLRGFQDNRFYPYEPKPYLHQSGPYKEKRTIFPVNGDLKFGTGDIDGEGNNHSPGDRRLLMAFEPFRLEPDSVCEFMLSFVVGSGSNYLNSIEAMKRSMRSAKARVLTEGESFPEVPRFSCKSGFPGNNGTDVTFSVAAATAQEVSLLIKNYTGDSLTTIALIDNGIGVDPVANDGIFSGGWAAPVDSFGLSADVWVRYHNGLEYTWRQLGERITTIGPVRTAAVEIGSENLLRDNALNNGENIRITFSIDNQSAASVKEAVLTANYAHQNTGQRIEWMPARNRFNVGRASSFSWQYSSADTFYAINGEPSLIVNQQLPIVINIVDHRNNLWTDTLSIPVVELANEPREYLATRTAGPRAAEIGYQIIDPSQLTGDQYEVVFSEDSSQSEPNFTLIDLTTGELLLDQQPFPDPLSHNMQLIDGFQILPGRAKLENHGNGWRWLPQGRLWLAGSESAISGLFPGMSPEIVNFYDDYSESALPDIKIVFDRVYSTRAVVQSKISGRYLGAGVFPGAVFDMTDPLDPRRISVTFAEDDSLSDRRWGVDESNRFNHGALETLYVINEDYAPARADIDSVRYDLIAWSFRGQLGIDHAFLESSGELTASFRKKVQAGNRYRFTPRYVAIPADPADNFRLAQNFPNPFNPFTTIRFYVEQSGQVDLTIFNVLGQKVRRLRNGNLQAGQHQVIWNGHDDSGRQVASGIYFYRLVQKDGRAVTRKMILLR